jgi:hypothetical protein
MSQSEDLRDRCNGLIVRTALGGVVDRHGLCRCAGGFVVLEQLRVYFLIGVVKATRWVWSVVTVDNEGDKEEDAYRSSAWVPNDILDWPRARPVNSTRSASPEAGGGPRWSSMGLPQKGSELRTSVNP